MICVTICAYVYIVEYYAQYKKKKIKKVKYNYGSVVNKINKPHETVLFI